MYGIISATYWYTMTIFARSPQTESFMNVQFVQYNKITTSTNHILPLRKKCTSVRCLHILCGKTFIWPKTTIIYDKSSLICKSFKKEFPPSLR